MFHHREYIHIYYFYHFVYLVTVQNFLKLSKPWPHLKVFPHDSHPPNFDANVPPLKCVDRDIVGARYAPRNEALYKWLKVEQ